MYVHVVLCWCYKMCFSPKIDIYDARSVGGNIQTLLNITAEGTQVYGYTHAWEERYSFNTVHERFLILLVHSVLNRKVAGLNRI